MGRNDIRVQMLDYVIGTFYPEIQAAHADNSVQRNAAFFREVGVAVPWPRPYLLLRTRSTWLVDRGSHLVSLPLSVTPLSQTQSPLVGFEQDRLLGNPPSRSGVLGQTKDHFVSVALACVHVPPPSPAGQV